MDGILKWMARRWAPSTGRSDPWQAAPEIVDDFAHYTYGAAMDALWEWYKAGKPAKPNPSQLLQLTAEHQRRRIDNGTDPARGAVECGGRHVWSHVREWEVEVCTRCAAEQPHNPARCPTCTPRLPDPEQKVLDVETDPDTF